MDKQKTSFNHKISKRARTDWGDSAKWYIKLLEGSGTYQRAVILPNMMRQLGDVKGRDVLDLACGSGFFAKEIGHAGARVIGVDASRELIEAGEKALKQFKNIRLVTSPAHQMSFIKDGTMDVIVCILAIQNIANVDEVLKECARVLKPRGRFLIVMNHPTFRVPKASDWGYDEERKIQYRRVDKYLSESKEKIFMHPGERPTEYTWSFHRPLQYYFKLLKKNGFFVGSVEEWISHKKSENGPRARAEDSARKEIPMFLFLEAVKGS